MARHFSLLEGWSASYPETTGYVVPTFLEVARTAEDRNLRTRARRMLDWLTSIQLPGGGFQGGVVNERPIVPVTFNTGQVLMGLAAGARELDESYREPMRRAADWLVESQDPDGAWRRHPSPFARPGEKTYDTHVAWGLLEAARLESNSAYGDAALRNIHWAISKQRDNGWFDHCCLTDPARPLTHTLGYALRGVLEAWRFSGDPPLLEAAFRSAEGLRSALGPDGHLPGRLDSSWKPAVPWVCLTGTSQVAHCWLLLYKATGDARWLSAARSANRFVRRTVRVEGPAELRGGVKGSFPVDGGYGTWQLLNWSCKFTVDANRLELELERTEGS